MLDGEKVRRCRHKRGWTQAELSYYSGVRQPRISEIESGQGQNPNLKLVFRLCYTLGLPIDEFLDCEAWETIRTAIDSRIKAGIA